ncbi:hypothetical protein L226DRAFT_576580 [Lentinus tigrinus ALCF2SS1-7]|uniref:Uncharacterized protein n=1 Tax=Lentinus tigrinus ALCF2SS1-6 TaxID=1328759 RepID=A0A5C2RRD8_9APHY|nr:hypothetical protein L227DRAFT_658519 [Lentinus tigrinus ALCF2SS1-6]RPD68231.1 hypothetical protein L226DRAFT_576580 [Lentinus tigrinus ALCF2SS1-7]
MPKRYMKVSREESYAVKDPEILPLLVSRRESGSVHTADIHEGDSVGASMAVDGSCLSGDEDTDDEKSYSIGVDFDEGFHARFVAALQEDVDEEEVAPRSSVQPGPRPQSAIEADSILPESYAINDPMAVDDSSLSDDDDVHMKVSDDRDDPMEVETALDGAVQEVLQAIGVAGVNPRELVAGVLDDNFEAENDDDKPAMEEDSEGEPDDELLSDDSTSVRKLFQRCRSGEEKLGKIYKPLQMDPNFRIRITSNGQYGFRIADIKNVKKSDEEVETTDEENESIKALVDQAERRLYFRARVLRIQRGAFLDPPGIEMPIVDDYVNGPHDLSIGKLLTSMFKKQYEHSHEYSSLYERLYVIAIRRTRRWEGIGVYYYPELQKRE